MVPSPNSWFRSPVLWFFLPGLVFVLWAWIHSMSWYSTMVFEIGGHPVRLENGLATAGVNWQEMSPSSAGSRFLGIESRPNDAPASKDWFPLPSYFKARSGSGPAWHYFHIPHWFLLLVALGLWQLPWLGRYYRRKRIAAAHSP
jgi:hypothetical protein